MKSKRNIIMIHCPACGTDVSPDAESCPKCGHPCKRQRDDKYVSEIIDVVSTIISIIIVIVVIRSCTSTVESEFDKIKNIYKSNTPKVQTISTFDENISQITINPDIEQQPEYPESFKVLNSDYNEHGINNISIQNDCEITYPSFLSGNADQQTGDIYLTNNDSSISLWAYKETATVDVTTKSIYNTILETIENEADTITYKACYSDRFYISGFRADSSAFYRHTRIHNGNSYTWILNFEKQHYDLGVDILDNKIIKFEFDSH